MKTFSAKDVSVSIGGVSLKDFAIVDIDRPKPVREERRLIVRSEGAEHHPQVAEALRSVTLGPAWPLGDVTVYVSERRFRHDETQINLHFSFRVVDRDTGTWTDIGISQQLTPLAEREKADLADRAIRMAFSEMRDMLNHELCEAFRVDGMLYRDPHAIVGGIESMVITGTVTL